MTTLSSAEMQDEIAELRLKLEEYKSEKLRLADLERQLEVTLHNLSVHQEELTVQNEELILSRGNLESLYNKYAILFEESPVGYFIFNKKKKVLETNHAAAKLLNVSSSSLLKKSIISHVDISDINQFSKHFQRVFDSGMASDEMQLVPTDKLTIPCIFQSHRIIDTDSGEPVSLTVVFDISEQKHNEQQIAILAERNRRILAAAGDGIIGLNKDGVIIFANPAAEKMLQWGDTALLGYTPERILEPLDQNEEPIPQERCPIQKTLDDGESRSVSEHSFIRRDESRFQVEYNVAPTYDENSISGLVLSFRDITQRKKAQEALRKAHDDLEIRVEKRTRELSVVNDRIRLTAQVFESTSEAIVITDKKNKIVEINPAFSKITGYSPKEVIGEDPGFMKSGRHDHEFYSKMWQTIWKEGFWQGEIWDRRKNGEIYPKWLSINTVKDNENQIMHCIGVFSDISIVKSAEEKLERLAFFDGLTSLPNRALFKTRLEHEFTSALRHKKKVALLFLDLDNFKNVNDTLGHAAGDQLLVVMADRIKSCVRDSDTVSRLGGDEFTVILTNIEDDSSVSYVANNILKSLKLPVALGEQKVTVGCSIGIAIYPDNGFDSNELIKNADAAMYHAKALGRNSSVFFTEELNIRAVKRMDIENGLRQALENDELLLHYQPKVDSSSGQLVGMEALIRWNRPNVGLISPAEFIQVAEDSGMIRDIGKIVLEKACQEMVGLEKEGLSPPPVSVNLSIRELKHADLVDSLSKILRKTKLSPQLLELEITESMMADDVEEVIFKLTKINDMGVSIAVDDFGTGYSSLSYLKRFPIHTLKIDRSFIQDLPEDEDDAAIVCAIISMAHSLGLSTVAEGVETKEQKMFLHKLDCNHMQGYFFSRPLPIVELKQYLKQSAKVSHPQTPPL
ncbi:MAG: EAL domain-containing protein [Magnetococcales bacterium]|nr:EAL domain-containing protein [Magnetococcales bacterium]